MSEKAGTLLHQPVERRLSSAIRSLIDDDFAFALWKLPHSESIYLAASQELRQVSQANLEESPPGYLFAPFRPNEKIMFLPADEYLILDSDRNFSLRGNHIDEAVQGKDETPRKSTPYHCASVRSVSPPEDVHYIHLVEQCRQQIAEGRIEKIVPSRSKRITLPDQFDLVDTFIALSKQYPGAMVSVFSSTETGTWIGATPEMLVSVDKNQRFHTAAVAGTQPYREETDLKSVTWTQKEIEEQALVERYIISCFKKIRLREFDEHGPKTVIAGNVLHLKTEFEVDMTATNFPQLGTVMLKLLHPTSAVCGMPLDASLSYLLENEGYDRQYYSGFLGPVRINDETHLFVNLRCMQLFSGEAILYAGAGVLADSDPEKECKETDLKMNTLLRIIRP